MTGLKSSELSVGAGDLAKQNRFLFFRKGGKLSERQAGYAWLLEKLGFKVEVRDTIPTRDKNEKLSFAWFEELDNFQLADENPNKKKPY